jgi:hypothetical protein
VTETCPNPKCMENLVASPEPRPVQGLQPQSPASPKPGRRTGSSSAAAARKALPSDPDESEGRANRHRFCLTTH